MSHPAAVQSAHEPAVQQQQPSIPEWDQNAPVAAKTETGTTTSQTAVPKPSLRERFDGVLPPDRKYLGLSRRYFLIAVLCAFLALLALIIGLAVGLTKKSGGGQNLPLPSNKEQFTGDLTYYGTGLGSCGITSTDNDYIVSVSHIIFDAASTGSNPNDNPLCGLKIRARRYDEEAGEDRSIDLKVVDRCTGCAPDDLDVSPKAFDQLAARASGRVDVTWAWLAATATSTS